MTYHYDPELSWAADAAPVFDVTQPQTARDLMAELGRAAGPYEFPDTVRRRSDSVATLGRSSVDVQVIRPTAASTASPALLWFHGGGFVFGDPSMDYALNAHWAEKLGVVVISVDYSLAPENPYPAAVEEGYAVLKWMLDRAAALDIDPARIAIGGHSAGGCLAAAVALMARDRGGPALCFQVLDLPVTDDRLDTPSMRAFTDTPVWTRPNAEASWQAYLGDGSGERAYAAPLRATDLTGLPPAYVSVAELDPLRDEGIDYARRLVEAGVSTELHLYAGTFHGSAVMTPDAAVTQAMVNDLTSALGRAFERAALSEVIA